MAEIHGRVVRRVKRMQVPDVDPSSIIGIEATNVAKGMNSRMDPADLSDDELTLALNCVIREDKLRRRPGTLAYSVTEPNANKILGLFEYKRTDGINNFVRCTRNSVHYTTAGAWVACTAGVALTGSDGDRFRAAVINDRFFFTNGVDEIQELDLSTNAYAAAGNWSQYKFLTGFHDRLVAAYLTGSAPNPVEIAWSAIGVYDETNPATNSSAGVTPLVESSADFTDFISGIFGFNNVMVVARERSIWYTPKLPSGTNPFNFIQAIPGVGSNIPDAIVRVPGGIIFPDRRNEEVFLYQASGEIEGLGKRVSKTIFASISDYDEVFAGYDPVNAEYTLFIPQAGTNTVIAWKYNRRANAWTKCEYEYVSAVANVDNSRSSTTIDELVGSMDSLAGTFNDLSSVTASAPQELFGRTDGKIVTVVDGSNLTDANATTTNYTTEQRSKTFKASFGEIEAQVLSFDIVPHNAGELYLYVSKDDGTSWTVVKGWSVTLDLLDKPLRINWKQGKRFKRMQWRLVTNNVDYELLQYSGLLVSSGETRAGLNGG